MDTTLTGPIAINRINTDLYPGFGEFPSIQSAVDYAVPLNVAINIYLLPDYAGSDQIADVVRGATNVWIIDERNGQREAYYWNGTNYASYGMAQGGGISTPRINDTLFVGTPEYPTIQGAVNVAVQNGHYVVVITPNYTGSENIAAITGGSNTVYITDQRNDVWQNYYWNGTSYVASPIMEANGIATPQINHTLFVGTSKFPTIQGAINFAVQYGHFVVVITPSYTGNEIITSITGGSASVYIADERTDQWQNYYWDGAQYVATPNQGGGGGGGSMVYPPKGIAVSTGNVWDISIPITVIRPSGDTTGHQDVTNIQAAIAPGAVIQLVNGTYHVGGGNATIQMNQACTIRGMGNGTIIQNEGTTNNVFTINYVDVVNVNAGYDHGTLAGEVSYLLIKQNPNVTPTAGYMFVLGDGSSINWSSGVGQLTRNITICNTVADGLWGGLYLQNNTLYAYIHHNTWSNFVGGGAIYYITDSGPGDNHICDNEFRGMTNSGIIIGGSDVTWFTNNKLNGSGIQFTGAKPTSSVMFSMMSVETWNAPAGSCMIDFGTGSNIPQNIQFNGGETAWFPTLFGNPSHVNGFTFNLFNTKATSDYAAGFITNNGFTAVPFPPSASLPSAGAGAMQLIQKIPAAGLTSVDFSSIPQTFDTLMLVGVGIASTFQGVEVQFNGVTSGYNSQSLFGAGSTPQAGGGLNSANIGIGALSNGGFVAYLPGYANAGTTPQIISSSSSQYTGGAYDAFAALYTGYGPSQPITSLHLFLADSSAFGTGSIFSLYGIGSSSAGSSIPANAQDSATFVGTSGTPLSSYSTSKGNTFALISYPGNPYDVEMPTLNGHGSEILTPGSNSSTYGDVYCTVTPASADYTVGETFTPQGASWLCAVMARINTATGSYIFFGASNGTSLSVIAGSTVLTQLSYNWPAGTTHTLTLTVTGTSIDAKVDGVSIAGSPFTDSSISAAGKAGSRISGASSVIGTNWYIK